MNLRPLLTTNNWWGKIIGAFLGYLISGPTGALFGILVGNFFDRGIAQHFDRPYWHYYAEKRPAVKKAFLDATFSILGHMAKVDGHVSEQDIKAASLLMKDLRLSREQSHAAKLFFNQGKQPYFPLIATLQQLKHITNDNKPLLHLFLDLQYQAAHINGLTFNKRQLLDTIFNQLGFAPLREQYRFYEDISSFSRPYTAQDKAHHSSQHQYQHQYRYAPHTTTTLEQAYTVLAVNAQSTQQEVKRAYRRLMSQHHPDKLVAKGANESQIKQANDKTQAIRKAYEQICVSKGWNH